MSEDSSKQTPNEEAAAPAEPVKSSATNQPDEQNLKLVSAVGYLGILFLVPMLMFPKEKFAIFHANQSLLLLITAVAIQIIGPMIPILGWFIIWPLGSIFTLVLFIIGLVNAFNGRMKRLPLVGGFDILKVQA